jgi:hypothetical protein
MDFDNELNLGSLGIDCALWGHIHRTEGSITSHPYDLATDNVCDGARKMRVVRVQNGSTVVPSDPIEAGSTGYNLRLAFEHPNDGTYDENAASIINNQPEDFEHAIIKFRMPADSVPYVVDAGELFQTVVQGDVAVCYVRLNAQAYSINAVNITPDPDSGVDGEHVASIELTMPPRPNPASHGSTVEFMMGSESLVRVEVFDVTGRRVRTVERRVLPAGRHDVHWDLRDDTGERVSSGVYLWRLTSGGSTVQTQTAVIR